jgi:hypothetical protein
MAYRPRNGSITAVVYDGVSYPITADIGERLIKFIDDFEFNNHTDWVELPTTDNRFLALRVGPQIPIAFEIAPAG